MGDPHTSPQSLSSRRPPGPLWRCPAVPDSSPSALRFFYFHRPRAEPPGCTTQRESRGLGVQGTWCLHQMGQALGPMRRVAPGMLAHRSVLPSGRLSMGAGGGPHRSSHCPSFRSLRRPLVRPCRPWSPRWPRPSSRLCSSLLSCSCSAWPCGTFTGTWTMTPSEAGERCLSPLRPQPHDPEFVPESASLPRAPCSSYGFRVAPRDPKPSPSPASLPIPPSTLGAPILTLHCFQRPPALPLDSEFLPWTGHPSLDSLPAAQSQAAQSHLSPHVLLPRTLAPSYPVALPTPTPNQGPLGNPQVFLFFPRSCGSILICDPEPSPWTPPSSLEHSPLPQAPRPSPHLWNLLIAPTPHHSPVSSSDPILCSFLQILEKPSVFLQKPIAHWPALLVPPQAQSSPLSWPSQDAWAFSQACPSRGPSPFSGFCPHWPLCPPPVPAPLFQLLPGSQAHFTAPSHSAVGFCVWAAGDWRPVGALLVPRGLLSAPRRLSTLPLLVPGMDVLSSLPQVELRGCLSLYTSKQIMIWHVTPVSWVASNEVQSHKELPGTAAEHDPAD